MPVSISLLVRAVCSDLWESLLALCVRFGMALGLRVKGAGVWHSEC